MTELLNVKHSSPNSEIIREDQSVVSAKCHFPKYFRSTTFYGVRLNRRAFVFMGRDPFDGQKILRKYYTKKTVSAMCIGTSLSKSSNQKLKVLKNLQLIVPNQRIKPNVGLKKLRISDHYEFVKRSEVNIQQVCKDITVCKNLQCLQLDIQDKTFSLKEIRKMRVLTSIKLNISEKQLLKDGNYLLQLKKLEKVDITIEGIHTDKSKDKQVKLLEFLLQLIHQNKLKALRLNSLQTSGHSIVDFIVPLLLELNMSQIEFWDLQVKSVEYNNQDIFELSQNLYKIDFLGLTIEEIKAASGRAMRGFLPKKLQREKEVSKIVEKRQKILDIYLSKTHAFHLATLLNGPLSLKGIHFSLIAGSIDAHYLEGVPDLEELQNVVLIFIGLGELEILYNAVPLIKKLKNAKSLKTLSLSHKDPKGRPGTFLDKYMKELTGISSLQKLQIHMFSSHCNIEHARTMLESMPALTELNLRLDHKPKKDETQLDLLIPFEKLKNLTKLRLMLSEGFGEENMLYLLENIENISNLERLDFDIGCKIDEKELFEDFMQKISELKKLKTLVLDLKADFKAVDGDLNQEGVHLIKNYWGSIDQMTKLTSLNSNLKNIDLSFGDPYNLGYYKY